MAVNVTVEEGNQFVAYEMREREIETQLEELKKVENKTQEQKVFMENLTQELKKINDWFVRSAKY